MSLFKNNLIISNNSSTDKRIVFCFWTFFILLMTEGICRRWVFPQFSNLFLIARDPFVLYAVLLGCKKGYLKSNFSKMFILIGGVTLMSTVVYGHGNIIVALYGIRISVLYFPFIEICSCVLSKNDIMKMGRILVLLICPMVVLNIFQYFSPQNSFVNIGIGGDEEGAGFAGALGYFRPPGIFTFISALTTYYGLSLCFLIYFTLYANEAQKYALKPFYLLLTIFAFAISMFVTISRTHFMTSIGILVSSALFIRKDTRIIKSVCVFTFFVLCITPILMSNDSFKLFLDVFFTRFDSANESEGGFANSFFNRSFGYLEQALPLTPDLGFGEGYFTNFGKKWIYGTLELHGNAKRLNDAAEFEWGRIIMEDGLFLGSIYLFTRILFAFNILVIAYRQLKKQKNTIAWILAPYTALIVANFQLKQAYNLGFMVVAAISFFTLCQSYNNCTKSLK